ncbi:MAG: O-antigen ligase family protein [Elusimicrobiota bacterium]
MPSVFLISVISCAVFGNSWNFLLQFFYQFLSLAVFSFIFLKFLKNDEIPYGEKIWLFPSVCALSALSWAFSPLRNLLSWELINFLSGAAVFFSSAFLKKEIEERKKIIFFIFSLIILVGFWQFFYSEETYSTLKNSNTLAFYSILAGGLALKLGNYYLALAFGILILVSKSVGAIIAVFCAALLYAFDRKAFFEIKANKFLFFAVFIMIFVSILSIDPSSIRDRLNWWKSALLMIKESPLYGWGTGSFAYVSGAFAGKESLKSVYAHNHYLEFAAENGIITALLWFYFLIFIVKKSFGFLRYALFAALIHSFFDFGMSSPYGFWLFCFCAGLSSEFSLHKTKESFFAGVFAVLFFLFLSFFYGGIYNYKKEMLLTKASEDPSYFKKVIEGKEKYPFDYDYLSFVAKNILKQAEEKKDFGLLAESAKAYEQKLIVNPWNPADYSVLERIYSFMKEESIKEELKKRSKKYLKTNEEDKI